MCACVYACVRMVATLMEWKGVGFEIIVSLFCKDECKIGIETNLEDDAQAEPQSHR